ncbi:BTAD domain-containing putative transcriptional regulator [Desulfobacula phenolica]|uniref:ATP-, maltotriose-and DNA-dependent transcriptional regulator MalT n=1 Tax=Desulfobacula phenolica TaxID=90732 RepID=A0A1H2FC31_9BACT|nr:BTAD domain-containing putative transcriptional regulator [Desulfobacula phenolica]SDU04911.1 ATP-, maltotriose-and DNA-dependent transcriptional regulator MalT [Desulfobacula phenolica]
MNLLNSKLQTPRRRHILHRERLIRYFEDIQQKKIIAVTAGAGYGKTTLVMDALAKQGVIPVWYRLDEQDTDFPVFISYLYSAVQQHFSGLKDNRTDDKMPMTCLKKDHDLLLEWLAFVEQNINQPTVFVLDDYHLVQSSQQVNHAIEFILNRLPDNIHLVIIGRKNLSLKLSTFRARDQLIEICEHDLSFTSGEIKQFFADSLMLTDPYIEDILASTGGWAASLVLLRYAFNKKVPGAISRRLVSFKQSPRYIFSYLKENIFDIQPEHIQTFMMKAALLPEIDTRRFNDIFEMDNPDAILKQMIEDHLMIFPVDESATVFYLHHLFKEFLITRLKENFTAIQIDRLHCRIAHKTEEDDIFQALHHFIAGHAFDEAIRLIESYEMKFLIKGKINFLGQCLEKIPKKIIEKHPKLLLAKAKLHSYFGNCRQAIELLTRACRLSKNQESTEERVKCLVELGSQYYVTGHVKEAKLLMEQVLNELEPSSPTYIIAMTYLTFLSSVLGEFETAGTYYKTVREKMEYYPDFERLTSNALINTSYTYTLYIKGEFEPAQQVNKRLLKSVLELKLTPCLPLVYYQLSATGFFLGTFEKGIEFAKKGIEICEKISLLDSKKGWIYIAWAQNCLGLGKYDRAIELISCGIELFEDPGNRWAIANALDCLHLVYLAQGKIKLAEQTLNKALDIIEGFELTLTEGILNNSCANLLKIEKKYQQSLDCLAYARPKLDGAAFYVFNNHLLTAGSFFELGRNKHAIKHLSTALSLSESKNYDRFVEKEREWLIPLLNGPLLKQIPLKQKNHAYLKQLFKNHIVKEPPLLDIKLLGYFELNIGKRVVPLSQWKSSKALMILKYLAAKRCRGFIPREMLIEILWPDENLQKTGSRFNMAMSALRKTLEPDLSPKAPSTYIERKKDTYRLYGDNRIRIDTEQFLHHYHLTKNKKFPPAKALETYLAAQSVYRGPFLEEDRYEDWCFQIREVFSSDYLKVLKAIVSIYETQKKFNKAILYARKILEADPFEEYAFKKLMIFYAQLDNLPETKKIYTLYKTMTQQIACPVSSDVKDLYNHLNQAS